MASEGREQTTPGRVPSGWDSPPPMVEQVREALHGNSDGAVEACRVIMRHAALCAVEPHACPTCSAIVEATNVR